MVKPFGTKFIRKSRIIYWRPIQITGGGEIDVGNIDVGNISDLCALIFVACIFMQILPCAILSDRLYPSLHHFFNTLGAIARHVLRFNSVMF